MTIFDDIRKDREAGGEWAYGDETSQVPAFRRMSRLDRLERIALAALDPDWIAQQIRIIDGARDKGAAQIGEELAAAFRAACGADQ